MVDRWVDLPVGAKAALIVVSGGGLASAAYFLISDPQVFIIIGIGLAILAALVLGYRWLLKKRKARKSKPFEQQIASSGGATPREVSDPSRRAQLDSLRKKFEEGLRVYRQRGKDLYSVPWYVVIGEPASGKSAAIRNSGVGFPPGLHEEMQGVGGTINMDWFFTNDAVVLDTAGRLAFEEVDAAKTTEWKEFLRLLRVARPRCPINGMLLFIPADSLKNDTADELDQKGSKIARQLDFMQQTLGVRFPLFVIVSKADLLVGFSEFFEGIADPREQFQIFGWSNPSSLDTAFQPREIQGVLGEIRERIIRRRSLLLKEPAPQTLVANRRIDEVDRMFLLPDETERIAPRLQRYLELIFAGGQWASPPPFLRGLYFTSALREGEAVDSALAEAIGIEASDGHEDRRWDTKRSFFLHDVFMEKVFRERGLVTAAPSPSQAKRSRRAVLFGAISAILILAIGLSGYSAYQFWHDLKGPEVYWKDVRVTLDDKVNISGADGVASFGTQMGEPRYFGADEIDFGSGKATIATLPKVLADRIKSKPIRAGGVFALFDAVNLVPDLGSDQWDAQRAVLSAAVVTPLLKRSIDRLGGESAETWTDRATDAYGAILGVWTRSLGEQPRGEARAGADAGADAGGEAEAAVEEGALLPVEALGSYFLQGAEPEQLAAFLRQRGAIDEAIADSYGPAGGGRWPPRGVEFPEAEIVAATDAFLEYRTLTNAPHARALVELASRLKKYREAERVLLAGQWFASSNSKALFDAERTRWNNELRALGELAGGLEAARTEAEARGLDLGAEFDAVVKSAAAEAAAWEAEAIDRVLASLPRVAPDEGEGAAEGAGPVGIARRLEERRRLVNMDPVAALTGAVGDLAGDWSDSMGMVSAKPRYLLRLEAYQRVGSSLDDADLSALTSVSALLARERGLAQGVADVVDVCKQQLAGDSVASVAGVIDSVARGGERAQRYQIATELLARLGDDLAGRVEREAGEPVRLDGIEVGGQELVAAYTVDRRFDPSAAGHLFEAWVWLADVTRADAGAATLARADLARLFGERRSGLEAYLDEYLKYWGDDVPASFQVSKPLSWAEYKDLLPNVASSTINERLSRVASVRADAIRAVPRGVLGDRAPSVAILARGAAAAYAECNDDDYRAVTGKRIREGWSRLPDDASRARRELLDSEPGGFKDKYLVHSADHTPADSIGFWDSLIEGLILSVASDAGGELSSGDATVRSKLQSQPFCMSAQSSLTSAEIAALSASIDDLLGSGGSDGGDEFRARTLGADGETGIRRIDDAIRTLRGAAPRLDTDRRRRLEAAGKIAAWLDKKPQVTIRTFGLSDMQDKPASEHQTQILKYLSIGAENLLTGTRASFALRAFLPQTEGIVLRFSGRAGGGEDQGSVVLPAPWGLLRLLVKGEPDTVTAGEPGENWRVPVRVAASGAQVWIGLTFSEPLPIDPSEWPGCDGGE